jgi:DNA-binding response OmpR family regulator
MVESVLRGLSVLVVEDQYYLATDICEWLRDAGAQLVGPAPNARAACELIDAELFDAAVVDINLGMGPTFAVAQKLAENEVPFLFATGYDQSIIPAEYRNRPRIEKPFKGPDVVSAVLELWRQSSKAGASAGGSKTTGGAFQT